MILNNLGNFNKFNFTSLRNYVSYLIYECFNFEIILLLSIYLILIIIYVLIEVFINKKE